MDDLGMDDGVSPAHGQIFVQRVQGLGHGDLQASEEGSSAPLGASERAADAVQSYPSLSLRDSSVH